MPGRLIAKAEKQISWRHFSSRRGPRADPAERADGSGDARSFDPMPLQRRRKMGYRLTSFALHVGKVGLTAEAEALGL